MSIAKAVPNASVAFLIAASLPTYPSAAQHPQAVPFAGQRQAEGKNAAPSAAIVDSQSVKNHGTTPATAKNILTAEAILWLICGNCDREAKAGLPAIIRRGFSDRAVRNLKFKCTECGGRTFIRADRPNLRIEVERIVEYD
jgi:hypothetical protein